VTEVRDIEKDVLDSLEIHDTIIEKITRLKRFLEKANTAVSTTVTSATPAISDATRTATASYLPKLDLPRYLGDPLGWQTFWDSFKDAVHSNSHLTGVEKSVLNWTVKLPEQSVILMLIMNNRSHCWKHDLVRSNASLMPIYKPCWIC